MPVWIAGSEVPSGGGGNVVLYAVDGVTPLIGQQTKANSLPVVLPSNQVGTAGTPAADVLSVQGVAGGTPQPVDSELPAAALLADGAALPTTPTVGAQALLYDGSATRLARGTGRGAAYVAPDYLGLALSSASPNPTNNDIVMSFAGAAPSATDFQIRNTTVRTFLIPIGISGWNDWALFLHITSGFDQVMNLSWRRTWNDGGAINGDAGSVGPSTIAGGTVGVFEFVSLRAYTGTAIPATPAVFLLYSYPAGQLMQYLMFRMWFTTAPTTGDFKLFIQRRT